MSIIVLEDYKAYAGIKNPNNDDKLQYLVDFANEYIIGYCNTPFKQVPVLNARTTCLDGLEIVLPNAPVVSIEELRVDGVIIPEEDFVLDSKSGIVEAIGSFSTSRFGVSVDFTYGHTKVPSDIVVSALELITHLHKRDFTKSKNIGGESVEFTDNTLIPPHIKIALDIHRVL